MSSQELQALERIYQLAHLYIYCHILKDASKTEQISEEVKILETAAKVISKLTDKN